MLINSKPLKYFSLLLSLIFMGYLIYLIISSIVIVKNQFIDIGDSTYVNQVRVDDYTLKLANFLSKDCKSSDEVCEVQKMLDFTTRIPYKVNEGIARSAKNVVDQNFGDCDDKSNLLISMLKVKNYEAYFVLVPKHIFVIVHLKENIRNKKALYINGKRFYKLESTSTNSKIGFRLKYKFDEIEAIIDPFKNKKLVVEKMEYK